jgi:hypothetical protein
MLANSGEFKVTVEANADLKPSLAKELIGGSEWDLDDGGEFCHFLCGVVLDVRDTLTSTDGMDWRCTWRVVERMVPQSKLQAASRWPSMRRNGQ